MFLKNDEKSKNQNHGTGFLAGLILGGILGVMYAPDKGEKTREKFKAFADDIVEKNSDVIEDVVTIAEGAKVSAQPLIDEVRENVLPAVERAKKTSTNAQAEVIEKIGQLVEELKDAKEITEKEFKKIKI